MREHERLEGELADWCGAPSAAHVVACSSGTAALHLALEALHLPAGTFVIMPDFTMIACPRAATLAGLRPALVDCRGDMLIDPGLIGRRAADAIMPVHVYGRRCDMDEVAARAGVHKLVVIEDLAEAHGVRPHHGSDAACWSFYSNKIVAGAEGGAVYFKDEGAAGWARRLRSLGFTDSHDFMHVPRGHNYRMSDPHAALVRASLARVDEELRRRREVEGWYSMEWPESDQLPSRDVVWVYDVALPHLADEPGWTGLDRLVRQLWAAGVEARHAFKPVSSQPEYQGSPLYCRPRTESIARELSRTVLYLPCGPDVTRDVVRRNVAELNRALGW